MSLTGNFGDGINRTIIENGVLTASSFTVNNSLSNQTQKIIFTITYSNNVQITTYGEIFISKDVSSNATNRFFGPNSCNLDPDIEDIYSKSDQLVAEEGFKGLNETIAIKGKLEVKVFYNIAHQRTIRKPILILDGFDPGDKRKITDCDCENDPTGDCQYNNRNKITNNFDPQNHKSLLELMSYNDSAGRKKDLIPILRTNGFDVVVINQPNYVGSNGAKIDGGADYIERNAKGIKQLIKILNSSLVTNNSTEKLVVVGPSMGGLVSRWALKELEDEGYDHNTKLWVSFDSPHQGANIPLAMQYAAEFTENFDQLDKLNRIASKQILVHHYTNGSTATGGAPNFRDRFNSELSAMCYPINNIKKIALVNGSSNGILNYSAGHGLANIHVWMTSFPYGNAAFGDLIFSNDSGINKVFEIRTRAGIASWTTTTKYVSSIINIGSYDSAPGCKFSLTGSTALAGYINPPSQSGVNLYGNVTQQVDYFTFMPTKSTLDFKGNSFLLREPLNNRNLVQTHETPFDDYYTPPLHEEHVELNSANVAWLLNQLNTVSNTNIAQNIICGSRVSALTINGNENLCDATQKTYTLEPANLSNVNWTVTNLEILYSNNQEIQVRKINQLQASSITASYTGGGSTVQHTKLLTCIRPNLLFGIDYNFTNNLSITLTNLPNEFPLSQQNIDNIAWNITSGDGQISTNYNSLTADVYGSMFAGVVTVTTVEGDSYSQNFSWPDQNNCTAIIKIGRDQYQVVDICNNNALVNNISVKEIYNVYGNKLENLPVTDPNINLRQGNKGDIQILRVVAGAKNLTTRIIKD